MPKIKLKIKRALLGPVAILGVAGAKPRAQVRVGERQRLHAVYANKDERFESPLFYVSTEVMERWAADGAGDVKHRRGRCLVLRVNLLPHTQCSESMGPDIVEGYLNGKPYAQSCLEMWQVPTWAQRQAGASEAGRELQAAA